MTGLFARLDRPASFAAVADVRGRRLLAAVLAALAAALAIHAARPSAAQASLLVAARDLAPGAVLGAADLTERHVPAAVRPAGALVADAAALGRILAAPVRRGEPIVDVRLVGGSLYAALGSGLVGAPVRLSDAAEVGLLRPGDVVDVVAAHESGSAAVVAPGARVVGVPAADRGLTAAGGGEGGMVILAVTPSVAVRLAATAADSRLSVVLRPP